MIMARNEDGTYSQVGFVKDNNGVDTEYIYDKNGDIVFEKGFTRETSGTVPLTINGIEKDLKAWSITGNTVQNGTPTPENPVEIQSVVSPVVKVCGKNLCDGISQGYYINTRGTVCGRTEHDSGLIIEVTNNSVITISSKVVQERYRTCFINDLFSDKSTSEVYDAKLKDGTSNSITMPNNGYKYLVVNATDLSSIQVEVGSTATDYEPYQEPITIPIYLSEPLQAGEVLRSDGSRDVKWGVKVFDGSENWVYGDENSYGIVYFYLKLNSPKYDNAEFTDIKCTHLPESKSNFSDSKSECCALWTSNTINGLVVYLRFKKTNMPIVDDLKLWLSTQYAAGTPVTILYPLAESTTETFTAPQIPTLNGTTIIDVDTAVKPTEMYTKYKSSK